MGPDFAALPLWHATKERAVLDFLPRRFSNNDVKRMRQYLEMWIEAFACYHNTICPSIIIFKRFLSGKTFTKINSRSIVCEEHGGNAF